MPNAISRPGWAGVLRSWPSNRAAASMASQRSRLIGDGSERTAIAPGRARLPRICVLPGVIHLQVFCFGDEWEYGASVATCVPSGSARLFAGTRRSEPRASTAVVDRRLPLRLEKRKRRDYQRRSPLQVVRSRRQLETGVHFCSGRVVSSDLASSRRVGVRA
jgi:hypothetical protein